MSNPDFVRSLMPDIVHETTTLDFSDLEAYCGRRSADFEQILEALMDTVRTIKHVKHVQATKTVVTVKWSYRLPTSHVARRELKIKEVVEAFLVAALAELPAT